MERKANTMHSYTLMRLDHMLDRYADEGWIDIEDLHRFVVEFRQLPKEKQSKYAHLLDECADMWDAAEQPENQDAL